MTLIFPCFPSDETKFPCYCCPVETPKPKEPRGASSPRQLCCQLSVAVTHTPEITENKERCSWMPVPKFQFTVWWSRCFGSGMDTVEGAHSRMVCLPPGGQQASGEEQEGAEVPGSPSRVRPQQPSVLSLGPTSWQRQAFGIQTIIVREELPPPSTPPTPHPRLPAC